MAVDEVTSPSQASQGQLLPPGPGTGGPTGDRGLPQSLCLSVSPEDRPRLTQQSFSIITICLRHFPSKITEQQHPRNILKEPEINMTLIHHAQQTQASGLNAAAIPHTPERPPSCSHSAAQKPQTTGAWEAAADETGPSARAPALLSCSLQQQQAFAAALGTQLFFRVTDLSRK